MTPEPSADIIYRLGEYHARTLVTDPAPSIIILKLLAENVANRMAEHVFPTREQKARFQEGCLAGLEQRYHPLTGFVLYKPNGTQVLDETNAPIVFTDLKAALMEAYERTINGDYYIIDFETMERHNYLSILSLD